MARPMVRTEYVDEDLMELIRSVFGSASNGWDNLGQYLGASGVRVSWWMFQRAFSGKPVEGKVVNAIQGSMDRWIEGIKVAVREKRRAELEHLQAGD